MGKAEKKMTSRTKKFHQIQPDWDLWQKLYYKHPQSYLRQRLLAIKYLWEGKSRPEVTQLIGCNYKSLAKWIDKFLEGGLQKLTEPITHQVASRLKAEQQLELKKMLLEQKPSDYGIDRYIWTGKIISQVIHSRWGVTLKDTRIYEILEQLNLSHQRGHRDVSECRAKTSATVCRNSQKKLQAKQEKEKIVFFDEFAVYDRPSVFYAWAEKNNRPQVPSNERQRNKVNGLLAVDVETGESPNFNLVEYLIHQLRLQLLHHQPVGITIELLREKIEQYLQVNQLQTPQQIQNTIAHICSLAQ